MANITDKHYPSKLNRFTNGCFNMYYSEPIAKGMYKITDIVADTHHADTNKYFLVRITKTNDTGWWVAQGLFSSGILSGELVDDATYGMCVRIHKDSFVTDTARLDFISKHSDIYYNYEVLRWYNATTGSGDEDLSNAWLENIDVYDITRIQTNSTFSPYDFVYSQDYVHNITTKAFSLKDLRLVEDIIRAKSILIKSTNDDMYYSAALSNTPDVIGITGDTADIIQQPYFGGLQDNMWYRAKLVDTEFTYRNGRYKGKLKLQIKG